jgi:hypothetical protein
MGTRRRVGWSLPLLIVLVACSKSSGNVDSADEIANKLAAANIACSAPTHGALEPPETSNAICADGPTMGNGAQIDVFPSHDEAVAAYRARCNVKFGTPGLPGLAGLPSGILIHNWLGGNWVMQTGGTASVDDIENAVGGVSDIDCQVTT